MVRVWRLRLHSSTKFSLSASGYLSANGYYPARVFLKHEMKIKPTNCTEAHVPTPQYGNLVPRGPLSLTKRIAASGKEIAQYGCYCPGDMVVRMPNVMAIPRSFRTF